MGKEPGRLGIESLEKELQGLGETPTSPLSLTEAAQGRDQIQESSSAPLPSIHREPFHRETNLPYLPMQNASSAPCLDSGVRNRENKPPLLLMGPESRARPRPEPGGFRFEEDSRRQENRRGAGRLFLP